MSRLRRAFRKESSAVVTMQDVMPIQRCFPGRRDFFMGLLVFVMLGNVTFVSYLWGDRTLQNSARFAGLYANGSASLPIDLHVSREADPTAGSLQTEPWFVLEREQLVREHRLPLWNPYSGFGVPLAANMQSQPYSPFAWIGIFWSSARGYDVFVAVRMIAAGFLTFLFLRTFVRFAPALAGGAAYMFTGYLWLFLSLPQLSVEVLTPGLLLAVECVIRRPSLRSAAGLGAMLGASLLGGMPESSALAVAFVSSYAVVRILGERDVRRTGRLAMMYLGAGAVIGVGLSAIAVIPFLEYVAISSNSHHAGVAESLVDLPPDPFTVPALAQYLAPLMFGPPRGIFASDRTPLLRGFFGISSAFFALLASFSAVGATFRKRPRARTPILFFSCVALIFLTVRFGFTVTAPIAKLPVFHQILLTKYEEAIVGICVASLVAFGIARLSERNFARPASLLASVVLLGILVLARGDVNHTALLHDAAESSERALDTACAFLVSAVVLVEVALAKRSISGRTLAGAAFLLVALELPLAFVMPLYYGRNPGARQASSALLGTPYVAFLKTHFTHGERFYGENHLLTPNWGDAFGIADVRDLDAVYPARYLTFDRAFLGDRDPFELLYYFIGTHRIDPSNELQRRYLQLSSVRYYGVDKTYSTLSLKGPAGGRLVFSAPQADLYELPVTLPRAALYRRAIVVRDGPEALRTLRSHAFSPEREAVVEGSVAEFGDLVGGSPTPVQAGSIATNAAGDVHVNVRTQARALLVLNDTNFPGWNATIDGHPAPIRNANYLFRGVVVPQGEHVVEFRYAPLSFRIGAALTLASFVLLILAAIGPALSSLRGARRGTRER